MTAQTIMLQGTGSDVGKSVLTSAFCRIFAQDGYHVAPFKSQNMALNSYITKQGGEIGRAQAVQAEAAEVEATVDMNPILLKPREDTSSQVIIHGRPKKNMSAKEYFDHHEEGLGYIKESLARLKRDYEVVVMEGAGSPAEVNLRDQDLVNMKAAELADAPVILVADIDRGGVFASIIGTFKLLNEAEANRIKGIIINKFRGDISRLESGLKFIEEYTGVPVLGVVPYFNDFKIPEEDSIPQHRLKGQQDGEIEIAILYLPHISNFTDFTPLEEELKTSVRYVKKGEPLGRPDAIIIPGSKNTIEDLEYLKDAGYDEEIKNLAAEGVHVVGICGGYQMLGKQVSDPQQVEATTESINGLGLLDIKTVFNPTKVTTQVKGRIANDHGFFSNLKDKVISGYEIHMGETKLNEGVEPLIKLEESLGKKESRLDGAINKDGKLFGTYLHGIFDNDQFRYKFINSLRQEKGLPLIDFSQEISTAEKREAAYERLAEIVRESIDFEKVYEIMDFNNYKEGLDPCLINLLL
ncbi:MULTISPECIES: cobyric acid synthase [unclassified Candidatus Frackibacter]|uniref:cobyric acid synthase n=1 Tax=unclassified Candidatus Frackibacter TaxID=2648818 RepID=UPI000882EB3B|nr:MULTISPECIES: cobyric acid synthase [unclassified Candidatus Frackibacter]SDC33772.1 adenosylcobyric acid synthase (glutamine-hydrolysing) [Candidatus Frackibacter sp. WG11]SEM57400.1 adenosylcobyric acid synthase (glutamine-hydrolysing) [Candidatus Frackibacter sp. WG12]SFL69863.1 adenosylcobyric acid synthase (glutamine-hydrolysing) [Candidatus Frackibacter sp. WG13]